MADARRRLALKKKVILLIFLKAKRRTASLKDRITHPLLLFAQSTSCRHEPTKPDFIGTSPKPPPIISPIFHTGNQSPFPSRPFTPMKKKPKTCTFGWVFLGLLALPVFPLRAQVPQMINYQGRVAVGTTNFNGSGFFRFALVNAAGTTTF
jgi:hypothetical protein